MDSTAHISELIDQLDENLDSLQDALKGILNKSLTEVAASYSMLDRAKFYILITYAIESAVFSFLRLNGMSAREHPVYRELERVKQYFQKAKLAEVTLQKPVMRLDQGAAGRFIKAALSGNEAISARHNGPSRNGPTETVKNLNNPGSENAKKRKAAAVEEESLLSSVTEQGVKENSGSTLKSVSTQSGKTTESPMVPSTVQTSTSISSATPAETSNALELEAQKAERKKARKERKKERKRAAATQTAEIAITNESAEASPPKKKQKKHKNKDSKDNP